MKYLRKIFENAENESEKDAVFGLFEKLGISKPMISHNNLQLETDSFVDALSKGIPELDYEMETTLNCRSVKNQKEVHFMSIDEYLDGLSGLEECKSFVKEILGNKFGKEVYWTHIITFRYDTENKTTYSLDLSEIKSIYEYMRELNFFINDSSIEVMIEFHTNEFIIVVIENKKYTPKFK